MEFSSMPLLIFLSVWPWFRWHLYNHPEHRCWFWAARRPFSPAALIPSTGPAQYREAQDIAD